MGVIINDTLHGTVIVSYGWDINSFMILRKYIIRTNYCHTYVIKSWLTTICICPSTSPYKTPCIFHRLHATCQQLPYYKHIREASVAHIQLTHWGLVTHICVGKLAIIGSDNGLSPGRRQAIIWTHAGLLLIWLLETNFNEILIEIYIFSLTKMHLKMSSEKWRSFLSQPPSPRDTQVCVVLCFVVGSICSHQIHVICLPIYFRCIIVACGQDMIPCAPDANLVDGLNY